MGAVYKGIDLMLEREVAIKVLKPELASQPQVVERFRSEAVTLAKLNHPNIATLFSFFRQGDYFFMVLEYVNGTPLDKIIEACGVMTCEQAIPLFSQMLEGIDHAHALGIIHRDLKPANMMLTENGLLKVLDFGIARALGTARMTRAGHLIGTIEYMSPEQVRGLETDARSDIYSLGMVLYEMLTGRVPFASDSEFELMKAQVEQLPPPPREFSPNIPEQVEWAILCATEKDPEKRFQTAGAFSGAIVDSVNSAIATGSLSPMDMRRIGSLGGTMSVGLVSSHLPAELLRPGSTDATPLIQARVSNPAVIPPATRLAPSGLSTADQYREQPAMTRFANVATEPHGESATLTPSWLQNLNWRHYAAGAMGLAFLLVLILVPFWLALRSQTAAGSIETPAASPALSSETDNENSNDTSERNDAQSFSESTPQAAVPTATNPQPEADRQYAPHADESANRPSVATRKAGRAKRQKDSRSIMEGP